MAPLVPLRELWDPDRPVPELALTHGLCGGPVRAADGRQEHARADEGLVPADGVDLRLWDVPSQRRTLFATTDAVPRQPGSRAHGVMAAAVAPQPERLLPASAGAVSDPAVLPDGARAVAPARGAPRGRNGHRRRVLLCAAAIAGACGVHGASGPRELARGQSPGNATAPAVPLAVDPGRVGGRHRHLSGRRAGEPRDSHARPRPGHGCGDASERF